MTKKEEWLAGTRSAVPIMLGYVPVGIAYGVMARQAGLNTWQTVLMSLTVYGGASEMMAAGMVAQGAAVLTIVLTTFILNLRHIIMSTCVFNQMQARIRRQLQDRDRFVAAVRLQGEINLFYRARVVTPGKFVVPPVYAEDMYRPDTYGLAEGDGSLTVIDGK